MPVMPNPEVIAHRGYAARYPENTLVALEAALRAGARHVEFDVQLTRDGVPVLQHDAELARTTGHAGRVMDLDLDTVRTLDAGETPRFGTRFTDERIPTLAQVVDLLANRPQATAFVEIKEESLAHFGTVRTVRSVLAVLEPLLARCVPISFSADAVRCARDLDAPAVGWVLRSLDAAHCAQARRLAPAYLFCDHRAALARPGRLWPGPWRWALYEVIGAGLARELAARGADLVETMAVGELLAGLASDES
ncbi:glycerophosphoryl diester phosphodiesterase [bacterium BMS3Bbin12]|nr:glycerophosphoryl diester phosphodiesterase [bacterium BMS3Abin12]GBE47194.1 glycerophosphoryl diester phosphodiesterase [bacterium BMS3Bbin12]GBE49609.1 glycerophosphoryl diester phosphodiesterase [bacterium BMS3Bbin13]HDK02599.1 glycerophosphodiester phosphodiesterase [Gammaproteobacteria bacterium]